MRMQVREIISDFSLLISIAITTLISWLIALPGIPMLKVPTSFTVSPILVFCTASYTNFIWLQPTLNRNWIINPMQVEKWWLPLACIAPAFLYVVLVIMDQQLTTVILNRKENKLRVGGSHG